MTDYPKINSRKMTSRQRLKLHRAIRYIRSNNPGPVSIRFEAVAMWREKVSITVQTRRDDAGPFSQRAIICNQYYHLFIGKNGGVKVVAASFGLGSTRNLCHVKSMINSGIY